ncbi:hypothetical protein OAJ65_01640 [Flavobacteriales bacterium]|nr:hypothetical protein [Flavobacteriales bacterium]
MKKLLLILLLFQILWSNDCLAQQPSWNCINGTCVDPGDGTGQYTSLSNCQGNCIIFCHGGTVSIVNVSCFLAKDGQIQINNAWGTPPFKYRLDTVLSTSPFYPTLLDTNSAFTTNNTFHVFSDTTTLVNTPSAVMPHYRIGKNTYHYTFEDSAGCKDTITIVVDRDGEPFVVDTLNTLITLVSAPGLLDGSIQIAILSGGGYPVGSTPPYNYIWYNSLGVIIQNSSSNTLANIGAGNYSLKITDNGPYGCESDSMVFNVSVIPQTGTPDDNFENYLEANMMGNGILGDDSVSTINISSVTNLNVEGLNISDLTGIEDFTALQYLDCSNNNISSLNLDNNTLLTSLYCSNNNLTDLDVSNNSQLSTLQCEANILSTLSFDPALTSLDCFDNQLTTLDLSNNPNLAFLNCSYNNLIEINVQNGNNHLLINPNFMGNACSCIKVDDEDDADDWILLDDWSSYSSSSTTPNSWDCINNKCKGRCDGLGEYTNLDSCQQDSVYNDCGLVSTVVNINSNNTRSLLKIVDILGRDSHQNNKTILFYIYDDGTVEKKIIIE